MEAWETRLRSIFNQLAEKLALYNEEAQANGGLGIQQPVEIKILGQCGLLLAKLPFPLAATMDLDAIIKGPHIVNQKLEELLVPEGIRLESDAHLIWMPAQTKYQVWFDSPLLKVLLAEPDALIASKAKFKRAKDKNLIRNYLDYFHQAKEVLKKWKINYSWVHND